MPERFSFRHGGAKKIEAQQAEAKERGQFYQPVTVLIENGLICNAHCLGCGIDAQEERSNSPIGLTDQEIITTLDHCRNAGILAYWLSGGEILRRGELVLQILQRYQNTGFDLQKINTNLLPFNSSETTLAFLNKLKEAGLGQQKNIIPLITGGLGYQQSRVPLINAVYFISNFPNVFNPQEAKCSLTITGNQTMREKLAAQLKTLYQEVTGQIFPEEEIPLDLFGLMLRGRAIDIQPSLVDLYPLAADLDHSFSCFDHFFDGTVNPRPILVVDSRGDIYPCSDFNNDPLIRMGNIRENSQESKNPIIEAIRKVNQNPDLLTISQGGIAALYKQVEPKLAKSTIKALGQLLVSSRHDTCRLLLFLKHYSENNSPVELDAKDLQKILKQVLKGSTNVS